MVMRRMTRTQPEQDNDSYFCGLYGGDGLPPPHVFSLRGAPVLFSLAGVSIRVPSARSPAVVRVFRRVLCAYVPFFRVLFGRAPCAPR